MNSARIFISYASEDRISALAIYRYLPSCGLTVWIDCECLLPGQNWQTEIEHEISQCDFFIALMSNNSITKKGYVQDELKIALEVLDTLPHDKIFLIPVRIEECHVQNSPLSSLHYIDMFGDNWGRGSRRILKSIGNHTGEFPFPKTALYAIVNTRPENFGPLLDAALIARDLPALSLLLRCGADPEDPTVAYGSPLEFLLNEHEPNEVEMVRTILDMFFRYGANPDQSCIHGSSLIAQLAPADEAEIMEVILQQGANVDFQDRDGQTCLMEAGTWGSRLSFRLLLQYKAKVELVDNEGRTALMQACAPQHFDDDIREQLAMEFVELLLAHGAEITPQDTQGRTAADYAAEFGLNEVEAFLRRRRHVPPDASARR